MANKQSKGTCFVIMPFSDPKGYEKEYFKKIYEQLFKPAIEAAGYEPYRVDDNRDSSLIQAKIFDQLINAPMVLCDLSTKNPNVLYELGIRHAFDKPVVLTQEEGQSHIFDIAGVTTISYRKSRLYDQVLEDQKKITDVILQTGGSEKAYSFMKLVNMQPAVRNIDDRISDKEHINILLHELYVKLADVEESIEHFNSANKRITSTLSAQNRIISATQDVNRALYLLRAGMNVYSKQDLVKLAMELDDAISAYELIDEHEVRMVHKAIDVWNDFRGAVVKIANVYD